MEMHRLLLQENVQSLDHRVRVHVRLAARAERQRKSAYMVNE
jgi:hypothetical protein